ncbi:MAG: hypothetical protein KC455_10745, partial [Carnobacterium sp.]|nr:hypothetical protein [Carnobacterium sp.]
LFTNTKYYRTKKTTHCSWQKGKTSMLLKILFGIFAVLLFFMSFFLISGKATVFTSIAHIEKKKIAQKLFFSFGVLFILLAFASITLIFYHSIWLSFSVLGMASFSILIFIFILSSFM